MLAVKKKIMVIDDSEEILSVVKRILDPDFDVVILNDESAIPAAVMKELPDLLILDILMKTTDGFNVISNLQNDPVLNGIPIVFLTAKTDPEDVRRGLQSGAYDYIKKPIEKIEFRSRIDSVLKIKAREVALFQKSTIDPLTKIYNRETLFDAANREYSKALRENKQLSLAMLDIDHFKNFNDTYGHQTGDQVLAEFCAFIKKRIRPYDIFGRYGGEEFVILFEGLAKKNTADVIEKIRESLNTVLLTDKKLPVRFSCGISENREIRIGNPVGGVTEMITYADDRLYIAKKNGRSRTEYE